MFIYEPQENGEQIEKQKDAAVVANVQIVEAGQIVDVLSGRRAEAVLLQIDRESVSFHRNSSLGDNAVK